jgi:hypothetical protein
MNILQVGILIFVIIESLNVLMLYFIPESKKGNGVGVFNVYMEIKDDDKYKDFVGYLINWVAGAKLIFIMIGIVVIVFGNHNTQLFTVVALILSIVSFYWKLYPAIKKMDLDNHISPSGYHKTLNMMIMSFIVGFLVIFVIALL